MMQAAMAQTPCTLLCHAHVDAAVGCLAATMRLCLPQASLRVHDDGTLTQEDGQRLQAALPGAMIVRRNEADARMKELLSRHPCLLCLRDKLVLSLKLTDAMLLSDSDVLVYVDSDVLFWRRCRLPDLPENVGGVFMTDRENSYSMRSWQKLMSGVSLPSKVNTGIIVFRRTAYDLEFLEWFVSRALHRGIMPMLEQTAWAALGMRAGCRKIDPTQVRVMREGESDEELVGGHFTARTRHLLSRYIENSKTADPNAEPVVLRTLPSGECATADLAGYEIRRILRQRRK